MCEQKNSCEHTCMLMKFYQRKREYFLKVNVLLSDVAFLMFNILRRLVNTHSYTEEFVY